MKRITVRWILNYLLTLCVFTTIYVILTERLSLENVLIGFGISVTALVLTHKVLLTTRYTDSYTISGYYIIYIGYLFFIILKSALVSLAYIFTRNIGINLIDYTTSLKDKNLKSMLANAITLTPGTVTADVKGDTIEVMKLCKLCKLDQTAGFARIEKVLKHMERNGQ